MPSYVEGCLSAADSDLEQRVRNCLTERHMPGLRRINVHAKGGTVRLSGRVHSFYEKQLCQSYCKRVPGVVRLLDEIEVFNLPR